MKNYVKRVILFWFCMVFYMLVQSQVSENRITGHVYDSQNLPLAGVNIKVKNTPYGTVSNEKGEFCFTHNFQQVKEHLTGFLIYGAGKKPKWRYGIYMNDDLPV